MFQHKHLKNLKGKRKTLTQLKINDFSWIRQKIFCGANSHHKIWKGK